YVDHTTVAGTRYWYRVAAFNAGGDSEFAIAMSAVAPGVEAPTGGAKPPASPNTPPQISACADRTVTLGIPIPAWSFTIGDAESAPGDLQLIVGTSNPELVPVENVRFGGTGATRTLSITPRANVNGWSTVWVKVSDGDLDAVTSFVLVVAVADPDQ